MSNKPVDSTVADKVELTIGQLDSLSTSPSVISQCLCELLHARPSIEKLSEIIESDPATAVKILTVAKRSNIGLTSQIVSIAQAIEKLSIDDILQAVLSIKICQQSEDLSINKLLLHCNAVAFCAKQISQIISPKMEPQLAYLAGLLHDVGKIAICTAMPKSFSLIIQQAKSQNVSSTVIEREHLGMDHTIIGKRLCQKWGMPNQVILAVWLHHGDTIAITESVPEARLAQIVQLADSIVRKNDIGDSGSYDEINSTAAIAQALSITPEQIEQIEADLDETAKIKSEIFDLDSVSVRSGYDNAIIRTAARLAEENAKCSQQKRRLAKSSSHFEFAREILSNINSRAQVADIAEKMAKTWQEFYQTGKVCLWLREQGFAKSIKAALAEGMGQSKTMILNAPQDGHIIPKQIAEKFDVLKDTESCGWLFEQLGIDFDLDNTKIIPLLRESKAVGAIAFEFRYPMSDEDVKDNFAEIASATAAILDMGLAHQGQQRLAEKFVYLTNPAKTITAPSLPDSNDLLNAVSEIAAGAAHELNNPLSVISGRVQLLSETETDENKKQSLGQIKKNAGEISGIIDGLMSYAKPQNPRAAETALSTVIEEAVYFATQRMGIDQLDIQTDIDQTTNVFIDSAQVVSAIANIICNAVESYPSKNGLVQIKADIDSDKSFVKLQIVDHGCGMDEQTLKKAKQPFFSAKPAGRKRGMGLAYADRLIELNAGEINITSQPGHGTTVTISLPTRN